MNALKTIDLNLELTRYRCYYFGNIELLDQIDFTFLCSSKCPGNIIINTQELAFQWREKGIVVASGFHSPVEHEVLNVLIKGQQPIVICPARSIQKMRIPPLWRPGIEEDRILIITPIQGTHKRPTRELCNKRNEFLSRLSQKVYMPYVDDRGKILKIYNKLKNERKLISFDI